MNNDTNNDREPLPSIADELQAEADEVLQEIDALGPVESDGDTDVELPDVPLDEALRGLLDITFNGLLRVRGEHWSMDGRELTLLSKAYAAVLQKYWPDLSFGVELTAIVVTVTVIGPRIAADQALRATAKKHPSDEPGDEGAAGNGVDKPGNGKGYQTDA